LLLCRQAAFAEEGNPHPAGFVSISGQSACITLMLGAGVPQPALATTSGAGVCFFTSSWRATGSAVGFADLNGGA
jgi:hypothetical protein